MTAEANVCVLCGKPALMTVNNAWFCKDDIVDGYQATVRALAIERGVDPDQVERMMLDNPEMGFREAMRRSGYER